MTTREEAVAAAGEVLAEGLRTVASMTVEEQARAAYTPTGPSISELEDEIRAYRAEQRALIEACAQGPHPGCARMTRCPHSWCKPLHPSRQDAADRQKGPTPKS